MVTISIGGMSVSMEKASEGWISQMVAEAKKRGNALCVHVSVMTADARVALSTPGCGVVAGGSRAPNHTERRILDAWNKKGLSQGNFTSGDVISFLRELARLI